MAGSINFEKLKAALGSSAAQDILDGMNNLLAASIDRLEQAMDAEEVGEKVDPHVTKMIEGVMGQAERLAKLRDPNLGRPALGPGGQTPTALPPSMTETQLTYAVLKRFEELGVPNNAITPEMIESIGKRYSQGVDFNECCDRVAQAALTP